MGLRPRVFEVRPGVGIGPVRLGMTPAEVRRAVGRCKVTAGDGGGEWVDALGLKVDYAAGAVAFAEAFAVARARVTLIGRDVFATPADDLVAAVVRHEGLPVADFPPGRHEYLFPPLRLVLFRGVAPDEPGCVFDSVSVHTPGYYET
ncbi:MAG TPA: hypothetical protein VH092_32845 [Urbifossiella sp.]|jgi:hypothetical protein|nr:hypothetical protein [Urbifossiella sp.]